MKYFDAKLIADSFVDQLAPVCDVIEVVGSMRRLRPEVGDLDIVVIPKYQTLPDGMFDVRRVSLLDGLLMDLVTRKQFMMVADGTKLKRVVFLQDPGKGLSVDLYVATPETLATLTLIRTGSREHNIFLCERARDMGMHLHANGDGVRDATKTLISCLTENDVFRALWMEYVQPENREV